MNKVQKRNKTTFIVIASVLIVSALLLLILEKARVTNIVHDPFYTAPADPRAINNSRIKNDPTTNKDKASTQSPTGNGAISTSEVPVGQDASINFTSLIENANSLSYSASISGTASDKGICTLTFTHTDAKPVVVTDTANSMVCSDASIPLEQFSILGAWTATLHYFYENHQITATSEIEIK